MRSKFKKWEISKLFAKTTHKNRTNATQYRTVFFLTHHNAFKIVTYISTRYLIHCNKSKCKRNQKGMLSMKSETNEKRNDFNSLNCETA